MRGRLRDKKGQMTVEMAVAFPALLIVAVIAVNALQFIAICASMDRAARCDVYSYAISPSADQDMQQIVSKLEQEVLRYYDDYDIECTVTHRKVGFDLDEFTATLKYHPTLFGLGLRHEIWGVPLPSLSHSTSIVVDCYKPGVLI